MSEYTKIGVEAELPPLNEAKEFPCGGKEICVANVNGAISALDNVCLHEGGPLGQGVIDGNKIVCPWHGWEFDAQTGEHGPGARVQVYPIKIENGDVLVKL